MRSSRWLTMIALFKFAKKQFNPPWGQDCCERPTPLLGDYVQLSRCEPQETTTVLAAVGGHQRRPALVAVLVPMVSSKGPHEELPMVSSKGPHEEIEGMLRSPDFDVLKILLTFYEITPPHDRLISAN